MVEEAGRAAESAAKEAQVGLWGSAKAGAAVGKAERTAARAVAKDAKKTVVADAEKIAAAAREAVQKDHALVQKAVETGGKELTGLRKMMFNIGNSRVGGAIIRNPKTSIVAGVAALGALTLWLRSRRKEIPEQGQLMPSIVPADPALETGPAEGRTENHWQQTVGQRGAGAPAR